MPKSEGFTPDPHSNADAREAERLRAINRAPEPIRDLFRRDLISKGAAVSLGTIARDTNSEKAAAIAEATAAVVAIVEAKNPTTPAEKRKVRREVNAVVRDRMSLARSTVAPKPPASLDGLASVVAAIRSVHMTRSQLLTLRAEIDNLLSEIA